MCYEKYEWDDPMSGEMLKYEKWCSNLDQIGEVTVSRWVRMCKMVSTLEMHHFADASSSEYATCTYLRILYEDGDIDVTFMLGKCRFVPFKPVLSIPRLELIATVLSVQLATKLRKELPQRYTEYFWTDSTVVLGYIKNTAARFKIFVANRVQKIHDGSSPEEWFHIDSAKNPSDDGSRAVWSARWLKGPDFLKIPELITEHINSAVAPDDVEVKCLSSFGDEHQVAVQMLHFAKELGALSSQNAVCRGSPLFKLEVFLAEDGLIRVGGRIRESSLSDDVKHPVVLPSNHGLSRLIIQHFHQGRGITCSEVRSHGFWILSLHRLVKKLIHSCAICSRLRGRPVKQKMADLPEDKLFPCSPFWFSGCDLFGRYVKSGRRECKRYGVMFTCLVSMAVHIEVIHSLTTDSFLNAFRRFVALRGSVAADSSLMWMNSYQLVCKRIETQGPCHRKCKFK
ncbi:hypothetical protein Pcinc_005134 [Petrolisthes cinctipes]|uniref:Integrase zinc-binding domain-containing protein n=1 Tax=Petrolisthes cinctipes TaxID=88211 RepID=A0AAE1GE89_PETCI|nr:hypothetical protein Pcinc_005134 [Petrolisthes cinctipes]